MEAPEYYPGGYYQCAPEKKAGGGGGDHFIVDDLLDFSNEEEEEEEEEVCGAGDDAGAGNSPADSSTVTAVDSCNSSFSGCDPHLRGDLVCRSFADTTLSDDLHEPYDELKELEWLSNFVEESFSSDNLQKLHLISGFKSTAATTISSCSESRDNLSASAAGAKPELFRPEAPVPGKARSKRSRAAPCSWSSRLLVLSPEAATPSPEAEIIAPAVVKKPAKKRDPGIGAAAAAAAARQDGRKCLHCATEKTPQWRTGPMGPKTLCNACGVRYKSGRLVPEYRPAASPTFMLSKHSNSHRKVLELRRQKEMEQQQLIHGGPTMYDGAPGSSADDFLIHHRIGPDFRQLI
ncbi:GATA transcription factor 9 [Typha angustifolia]|uniref:GATA transcription factor 9 n=1 Tax=Typha angustifolia TaxID=59011 RepID=UPI003C2DFF79